MTMNTIMLTVRIYNNLQFMKKYVSYFMLIAIVSVFVSCASSKSTTTVLSGTDISKYKYVVFGTGDEGDAELADMLMMVQNEISSPKINVKTEKWDGGHTYISISFYDYDTNQSIAVIKSSGIGWSISQDQKLAYKAIKKELDKVFPQTR